MITYILFSKVYLILISICSFPTNINFFWPRRSLAIDSTGTTALFFFFNGFWDFKCIFCSDNFKLRTVTIIEFWVSNLVFPFCRSQHEWRFEVKQCTSTRAQIIFWRIMFQTLLFSILFLLWQLTLYVSISKFFFQFIQ